MNWKNSSLGLATIACLAACSQSSAPSTSDNTVETAYAALVADAANCAKQVKTCLDAAGSDDAAVSTCRAEFGTCRESAGKRAANELAGAVRSCTSRQNECVRAAEHGEAGSCQDELRMCLGAAHADNRDDDDAGTDERKAKRADCLDELHACVKADGPANACSEKVRMCVVDSVPSPLEVAPEDDEDEASDEDTDTSTDEDADEAGDDAEAMGSAGSGMPSDPGAGHGKPADAGNSGKGSNKSDAGAPEEKASKGRGMAKKTAARMCVETFSACVDAGTAARSCAASLKECRAAAKP